MTALKTAGNDAITATRPAQMSTDTHIARPPCSDITLTTQ